jgi:hypothetical protein
MLKQVMLIASLFLFVGQVKSEDTDQEVQLICPDGWVAYELYYYRCSYGSSGRTENCSTCLTCVINSRFSHFFTTVELCVVFRPDITRFNKYYNMQPVHCGEKICNELYYDPFYGMALTLNGQRITSKKALTSQTIYHETQNNTIKSVELICPRSSSFKSLYKRNIIYIDEFNNTHQVKSLCAFCDHNSATGTSGKPLRITMCSPRFYPEENKIYYNAYKNLTECQDTNTTRCPSDTIPPIQKGLHCGSKFTGIRNGELVNISNYIPCTNGKTDTNLVKLTKS